MNSKVKGYIYVGIAQILWATIGLILRNSELEGWVMLTLSGLVTFVIMCVYLLIAGKFRVFFQTKFSKWVYVYPFVQTATGFFSFSALADKNVLTSVVMLVFSSATLLTVVIAPILIGEKSTKAEIRYSILGFAGLMVFILSQGLGSGSIFSYGMGFAVLGLISNSISSTIIRKITVEVKTEYFPFLISLGNVFLLLPAFFFTNHSFQDIPFNEYLYAFFLSVTTAIAAFSFLTKGYKTIKVQEGMIIGLFQPVVVAIIGYLFLSEQVTWTMLPGALIIFASNYLLIKESTKTD